MQTITETTYSNNIKIRFIQEQMRKNYWLGSRGSSFDLRWWYERANESLESRILMYK